MPAASLPKNESARLRVLSACRVLDTPAERAFDELTSLAARLAGVPIALVSLVDESRQWFKSTVGLDATETPRDRAVCAHAILSNEPLVIPDLTQDPRTADNPLVVDDPRLRFYAGFPLILDDEFTVGTLCVIDVEPRKLDAETFEALEVLAHQVTTQLELRRQIHRIETAESRAQAAYEAKTMFLANMNHEIRTPLTAILGFTDMLLDEDSPIDDAERVRQSLGIIRENGQHLLRIVNDVLDLSKVEQGRLEVEALRCDPVALAESVSASLGELARRKSVELEFSASSDVPSLIESDPTRIRQALINLVGNAIKFTSRGRVDLRVDRDPDHAERIRFTIEDTGIGLSPDQLHQIRAFEPFVQGDASVSRTHGGSGLGLTIATSLATLLGGELTIESELGVGPTVTLTIAETCPQEHRGVFIRPDLEEHSTPREESAANERRADSEVKSTPAQKKRPLDGVRVLVAEPGADNQRIIRMFLEKAGAVLELCENGQLAVDAFEASPDDFDLVLLDMQMPVLDGYRAATRLRELGWTGTIYAVTANALDADRKRSLDAGCDDVIPKPINRKQLIERCEAATRVLHD